MLTLDSVITDVPLIGPTQAGRLEKLNIRHVVDLLTHFPSKYLDSSELLSINDLKKTGEATIKGEILSTSTTYTRARKTIVKAKISDGEDTIELAWFNQPYMKTVLKEGSFFILHIKQSQKSGNYYCKNYEEFNESKESLHLGRISPQYPQTAKISSKWLRSRIKYLLDNCDDIENFDIPKELVNEHNLVELKSSLSKIHFPESHDDISIARDRLSFDEMLTIQLQIQEKRELNKMNDAISIPFNQKLFSTFLKRLPFDLTSDQTEAIKEIGNDMDKDTPMHRLLNGDVGSGKTVVALSAIIQSLSNDQSVILLAPTTILAKQHYDTLAQMISDLGFHHQLLTSETKSDVNLNNLDGTSLIVGTHAILHSDDLPNNTALVVIDEQHRFGVDQRNLLKEKVTKDHQPHYLMMTATPIPRTLTNTLFGDMDVSFIESMPHQNGETSTYLVPRDRRSDCYDWIQKRCQTTKEQAFIIFPLIEENPEESVKSVKTNFEKLSKSTFKDLKCEILHGKIKPKEKDKIMERMQDGEIDILFSTTVIEVGMDISNATMIVIEGAETFGLAQLHQLRGRVGRNEKDAFCYLLPSVEEINPAQEERLKFFSGNKSGFDISEFDLNSRGPGEVFGTKQAGIPDLLITSILDKDTIKKTKGAVTYLHNNPSYLPLSTIFLLRRNLIFET